MAAATTRTMWWNSTRGTPRPGRLARARIETKIDETRKNTRITCPEGDCIRSPLKVSR